MVAWTRAVLLAILSWTIPFAASFALFPVKKLNPPMFSTAMYLIVLITGGALLMVYFRKRVVNLREAGLVGALWLAVNLVLDYPMFSHGPMKMTPLAYYSEIGLVYLTFPAIALFAAAIARGVPSAK